MEVCPLAFGLIRRPLETERRGGELDMNAQGPDSSLLRERESKAIEYARGAGQILLDYFQGAIEVKFKSKGERDPVTLADTRVESYLKESIGNDFPKDAILGEEGETVPGEGSPFVWVLDPLDGTSNFLNGLPLFAVSIGVLWNFRPVVASIYVPTGYDSRQGVYHATSEGEAYFDDQKLSVKDNIIPDAARISSFPWGYRMPSKLNKGKETALGEARSLGSIALELALCTQGAFKSVVFVRPRIWDVAAGTLLVQRVGGLVLTRGPRRRDWRPLVEFQSTPSPGGEPLETLRKWSQPVIAGDPPQVWRLAAQAGRPLGPLMGLAALLRRLVRGKKGGFC